jgi:diaminobutyrate-2-oxoglutarate transaminase
VYQHNHHAFATGARAVEKFWADGRLSNQVGQRAALLIAGLQGIARLLPNDDSMPKVVGRGLLQGLRLPTADLAQDVVARCFRRGLLLDTAAGDGRVLRLMPALTLPTLLLEQAVAILYRCVADATGQRARSAPHRALAAVHAAARRRAGPQVLAGA